MFVCVWFCVLWIRRCAPAAAKLSQRRALFLDSALRLPSEQTWVKDGGQGREGKGFPSPSGRGHDGSQSFSKRRGDLSIPLGSPFF